MAGSSALPPVRSISLPSRLNPTSLCIEDEFNNLRKWEESSKVEVETLGVENIQTGLVGIANLYNCAYELIHSSSTHKNGEVVEKALDDSITFLDVCSSAKDMMTMMRENVQLLQSALRRKGVESSIHSQLGSYIRFRKKMHKDIYKCIRALKQNENKIDSSVFINQDQNLIFMGKMLREISNFTKSVLQSLMLFLSSPVMKTKLGGCSFMSKIIPIGLISFEKGKRLRGNEVGDADFSLYALHERAKNYDSPFEVPILQRKLMSLAGCMDELEVGLDCMYKCLIQYRVCLLNVLTNQV